MMPISRMRSLIETNMMFITPIPPIKSVTMPATPRNTCIPIVTPSTLCMFSEVPKKSRAVPGTQRLTDFFAGVHIF